MKTLFANYYSFTTFNNCYHKILKFNAMHGHLLISNVAQTQLLQKDQINAEVFL
jgi:hypothetical protein